MSTLRRKFTIAWADGDPVEIVTSARDMAMAAEYGEDPVMGTFALIHAALVRLGHTVPDLDVFVDQLDEMDTDGAIVPTEDTPVDPTVPVAYTKPQLPSRV